MLFFNCENNYTSLYAVCVAAENKHSSFLFSLNGKLPTADINVNRFFELVSFVILMQRQTNYLIC